MIVRQRIHILGEQLFVDARVRSWCKLPYPGHPSGCPNYNHKPTCPPKVCWVNDFFDFAVPLVLGLEPFDIGEHVASMRQSHPGWSDRQARCVLYWQAGVNKRLKQECALMASSMGPSAHWTTCPEAMGVNVIRTLHQLGVPIKTHPTDEVVKVGLVGYRKLGTLRVVYM